MAAGRKSVLLKRESFQYSCSIKKSDHYTNVSSLVELGGLLGGQEEKEQGEIYFEHGDKALPPPGKKRKFSPIVWDLSEKETRISSKSRVSQVAAVSPNSSSGLPQEHSQNCAQDGVEESEVKKWNISMSRWASDGLSAMGVDDKNKQAKGSSSHEVDESQSDCSESTITRSIGSSGRYHGDHDLGPSAGDADFEKEFLIDSVDDVEEQDDASDSPSGSHGLMHVQRNINMLPSCRSVCEFEMIKKINEGTYGVVYKARDKKTGEIVALKKVKMNMERDGFPLSSLREINILSSFNHPSIVDVKEVVVDDYDGTFMVMEYMEHDLKGLMEVKKHPFSIGEIKYLMLQLLEGVKYLHDNWVLHRDLKTSNILLNKEGDLKICDFGMSRQYGSPRKPYTPVVVTLWYRAPELLLGSKEYSTAVDMWSVGCVMAELVSKEPLFRGKTELEQLDKIFRTLGTPEEKIWPGLSKLPGSKANFVKQPYNMLRKKFPAASFTGSPVLSELGLDLLKKLLTHDPEKRITAEAALLHDWFREAPLPKSDFKPILPWRC